MMEQWTCGDCGQTDQAAVDDLAGERVTKTVGEGRRAKTIETTVCPECGSENWYSDSVREALLTADQSTTAEQEPE